MIFSKRPSQPADNPHEVLLLATAKPRPDTRTLYTGCLKSRYDNIFIHSFVQNKNFQILII